ncbi:MAG: mechanosensitive ion channel family protein [Gemmatimonadales bacterium]|nr:MAG: mechanosensitive ion channel family protein [Gemmatimonadales bacterium]
MGECNVTVMERAETTDRAEGEWRQVMSDPAPAFEPWAPWVESLQLWGQANPGWATGLALLGVFLAGVVLLRVVQHYILRFVEYVARQTPAQWDQALFDARFPQRLSWGLPLLVWYFGLLVVPYLPETPLDILRRVFLASMILVVIRAFDAFLDGVNRIYIQNPRARERPIKGFLQLANVVAHLAGIIIIVSILMDRNPAIFLGGLGAMTAVLLLVFRDTLLSLVAGIQITTNDTLRTGDWIEMPQFQADGDVVDIALNTITVQNWDRTLTYIPTHKFLEHSFRNWRGMTQSGGRRIKRSIYLDQNSVRFLTDEEIERLGNWSLLKDYMERKRQEVEAFNRAHPEREGLIPHRRRLTNLGTFRAYLTEYIRTHPNIHPDLPHMVRQMPPGPDGIPMEIYGFSNDVRWVMYEGIQGDIFDHILATIPEFGLRVFQKPTGADLAGAVGPARGNGRGPEAGAHRPVGERLSQSGGGVASG